jgi:predicted phosphoribosyltransferase
MIFIDRSEAGRLLAARASALELSAPVVFALPRGGVPVGFEVARALGAPLALALARKLGVPGQPELGMGAVASGGVCIVNREVAQAFRVGDRDIAKACLREMARLDQAATLYGVEARGPDLRGRTAVLVDDGIATGVTARAAVRSLLLRGPRVVVVAVPVCAPETLVELREDVDDAIALITPPDFSSVGEWYGDFPQIDDVEVCALLARARDEHEAAFRGHVPLGP